VFGHLRFEAQYPKPKSAAAPAEAEGSAKKPPLAASEIEIKAQAVQGGGVAP
jgi:hypothetical protein